MSIELEFEWDSEKEKSNIEKHGVSFHEGATVLGDPLLWTFQIRIIRWVKSGF